MKKIETLTPEQEANIIPHRDFWLNYILSCKNRTDRKKAKKGVEWLYKFCGKKPPVIIWMDSPYGCQVAANFFEQFYNSPKANIRDNIRDNIGANIGANIWDNIWDNIGDNIGANIRDNIRANIWDNKKMKYYDVGYRGGAYDYGWVAWIDYFLQNNLIKTDKEADFNCLKELLLSGVFDMIQLDGICFVSDMPTKIMRNPNGRLHSPNGFAVEFKDGFGQHYINGRYISHEIFNKAAVLTKKQFLSEKNSDHKGAWYEILGQKKMMDLLGAKEVNQQQIVHKNGDIETVTLLKTTERFAEIDNQPFAWVKMVCPSTGTQYLQGVEPHHKDALSAIASLSPFKKEEYSFDFRS